ncbi:uncharacterized protein CLUP02_03446 [Colletotrichum lupini]|uniref:Mitochondrial oxaloacetate transport protein n=6 Tax=Colletotrichum acutatum species complex TaxID=2707335 RepID=A0A9Q8SIW7_9PEZI|nr:uncharacterized protein CLUP02_03446 [Colletotrichum lupini]UQC77973.1 hypothetical protein CLUP02_03446 [Colletotrichum lupini]
MAIHGHIDFEQEKSQFLFRARSLLRDLHIAVISPTSSLELRALRRTGSRPHSEIAVSLFSLSLSLSFQTNPDYHRSRNHKLPASFTSTISNYFLSLRQDQLTQCQQPLGNAFIAGGIAACGAVTATHPFETVKIRMQLQGELKDKGHQPHQYRGPLQGVSVIVRNEGVKGIYRGIGCAYIYQVLLNGCRLGFYEPMRETLSTLIFKDGKTQSLGINMACGAGSGIMGAAAGSPFFLVKTRLQSYSPFMPTGTQHKYRNAWNGMTSIYGAEGIRGLYRGVGAAMIRTGFGSSVQLPTYFFAKRRLVRHLGMEEGLPLHLASSTVSGFVVCCVMHPPDTIMSRLYNQNGNLYKGVFDCLAKTVRTEGFLAIYKGFLPHLARILPHTILTLTLAEQTNKLMRKLEDRILPSATIQTP